MTRQPLAAILVLGIVVSLAGGTGVVAVFTDTATTGGNSVTSGEQPGTGGGNPADLEIAEAAIDPDTGTVGCGAFVDDLTTGLFSMADAGPGDGASGHVCLRNAGDEPVAVTTRAFELVDVEVGCSPGEAEAGDTTCGEGDGELSYMLIVSFGAVDCAAPSLSDPTQAGLADMTSIAWHLVDRLDPAAVVCVRLDLSYPIDTAAANADLAQSDQTTWRFAFDVTVPLAFWSLSWGSFGHSEGEFAYPEGIALNSAGHVFVSDNQNHRIQEFTAAGDYFSTIGEWGYGDGQMRDPAGIAIDAHDNLYVADAANDRIQKFDSAGAFVLSWGGRGTASGQFWYPVGIDVDGAGNVYVADTFNDRVQVFSADGDFIRQWGGTGSGEGEFNWTSGIAVGSDGSVFVADQNNGRIQKFDASGAFLLAWGNGLEMPMRLDVDSAGNVYAADHDADHIAVFSATGELIGVVGTVGQGDGQLSAPLAVAVGSDGLIYVADSFNHRVSVFAPTGAY